MLTVQQGVHKWLVEPDQHGALTWPQVGEWTDDHRPFPVPKLRSPDRWAVGVNLVSSLLSPGFSSTDLKDPCRPRRAQTWANLQGWAMIHILDAWKRWHLHPCFSESQEEYLSMLCSICWCCSWSRPLHLLCDLEPSSIPVSQICEVHREDSDERWEG